MKSGSISAPATGWGSSTPPELLLQVLHHLVPGVPRYNTECVDPKYIQQRSYFAQLRLVCKAWDNPVLDLLFQTILLFMRGSDKDTRRNLVVLDYHPNLVRSLIIVTKPWAGRGADIARSEFEEKGDFTFLDRRWPKKSCPGLASTVTSLKLAAVSRKTCSLVLNGLGRNLTSLEVSIKDTRASAEKGPIHMPSIMPHLSRFTFKDHGDFPYDKKSMLRKIFSRIVNEDEAKISMSKRVSPLRHLSLDAFLDPSAVITILTTNNIGQGLTSFAYPMPFLESSEILSLVIPTLKLCPRLQEFSLRSPCHGDIFKYLPHTLRRLTFFVDLDPDDDADTSSPVGAFEKYLKSQAHSLEYVNVHLIPKGMWSMSPRASMLGGHYSKMLVFLMPYIWIQVMLVTRAI
ncbi:hypothetical protein BD779DRAFT_517205 [Infundibulicybe gibba]|nr:hypothetical protein BD779DRAFT_517205 [Infundibulicybe gibba]